MTVWNPVVWNPVASDDPGWIAIHLHEMQTPKRLYDCIQGCGIAHVPMLVRPQLLPKVMSLRWKHSDPFQLRFTMTCNSYSVTHADVTHAHMTHAQMTQVSWRELCCMCGRLTGQRKRHAAQKTSLKSSAIGDTLSTSSCRIPDSSHTHPTLIPNPSQTHPILIPASAVGCMIG